MGNSITNFRGLAKKLLDEKNADHETRVKSKMVPLLLGPYDFLSISEMEEVKNALIKIGYVNSIKLQDIQTETNFQEKLDLKFSHMIDSLQEDGHFIIPVFYFPRREEGKRMGHHAELIETTLKDYTLILSAGLFYHKGAVITHHHRVFLHRTCVNDLDHYKGETINHVNKFFPILEKKMMPSRQEKIIYRQKNLYLKRGEKNGAD